MIKTHNIELNDTSASEMARFRQIMLNIWRQQIEDDKNAKIMVDSFKNSQISNTAYFISIVEVIDCIKRNIGQLYPKMLFSDFIGLPNSTPEKTGIMFYNDSQGTQKTGAIHLEWNYFLGLNLIPKTFKLNIKIGKYHTEFTLAIFDHNLEKIAFKFIVYDFDHFLALLDSLGVVITSDEQIIIDLYHKKIKEANGNPNKLDVIYESLPKTLFGKMDDDELYAHLNLILKDNSLFEGIIAPTNLDTNEDKAILQILYAIKDRQQLYVNLRDTDLLYTIYSKLHGEEIQDLLRFLTRLVSEFDNTKPTETVYFDNSYYLFRDTHIKTEWSGSTLLLNNYKKETNVTTESNHVYVPMGIDSSVYSTPSQKVPNIEYYIKNKRFNPLEKLNFGTKLGELGEQIGDDNTFVIALKIHDMSTKQSNWDLFNIATDLLSLLSAYGALRVVLAKGAPLAARAIAGLVLAKDTAHYAMLSNETLEKWHENGYGWLANLWIAFSVTTDLASFGLPNLSKIAKEGKIAAELAETAEDAKQIKRVADEANKLVKAETGKDVSKMTKQEFDDFLDYLSKWENKTVSRVGYLGAKKLSKKELNTYIRKINEMSNGKSKLVVVPKGHEILQGNKAGFHPFSGTLYVEKGATEYEVFHEFKHFEEFRKIGKDEYLKGASDITQNDVLDAIRTYKREKYVFNEIMKHKSKFNDEQIKDAQDYMKRVIIKCERLNIDINDIK
ncbi:zincin-like metallopeptidase toxin domain-containing protein [Flavobacterium nitrogenifigens]|uniref:Metallopeptidase toxin 4 n=1 Tax=Flavobacterium nitrogenifigens TaxID=1617283 RepID=A0A521FAM4_9FLAO|nr:zincin-like metallopeptidase toxin domain-containing protein [Flavobacterium nitrogenifigens]KAF2337975.1 hypothetical protein DM397_03300 [Flavobacterium nitrogenifigens]SMO93207.1 Metallopeptidase toxin 4 [Flavobacterium nitrogenifigens]